MTTARYYSAWRLSERLTEYAELGPLFGCEIGPAPVRELSPDRRGGCRDVALRGGWCTVVGHCLYACERHFHPNHRRSRSPSEAKVPVSGRLDRGGVAPGTDVEHLACRAFENRFESAGISEREPRP
jgi:hypothetical protein